MCAYAINLAGIKEVMFGCENDKFGGTGSILSLHKFTIESMQTGYTIKKGILKEEAIKLL